MPAVVTVTAVPQPIQRQNTVKAVMCINDQISVTARVLWYNHAVADVPAEVVTVRVLPQRNTSVRAVSDTKEHVIHAVIGAAGQR